ncbi:MAG TPA: hypothetical protein VKD90_02005 [Gemmataceae bacterium]|nr:hypothetical protein [Gemmataceae bacterium]
MCRFPTRGSFWLVLCLPGFAGGDERTLRVTSPMSPPAWALLERQVLDASSDACREFFRRYFDHRGWLLCVERWGGDDGPDDAIENCNDWPILHALGGSDEVRKLYEQAWEGHLRQYTLAKTTKVPFAKEGMYFKEFPVMFDWLHHAEGLTVFQMQGLSDPHDPRFLLRARRFAGFYLNEDPGAPNYDPKHRVIRSMFNGSRGPLLRKATALDWAGDPIEVKNRFKPGHGETSYDEMLAHFKDYNDIVGDHPQNLMSTSLALTAYMATGEAKYKDWILEYADAWRQRIIDNDGIIPTNVGPDGKIGSAAGGKWYGGVYGWGFSVVVPQTGRLAHRNNHHLGLTGFGNAYLLTGDDRWLDPWRRMIDKVNAQGKPTDGVMTYPHMYGDKGWYDFTPERYRHGAEEIWYWSMKEADRGRLPEQGWVAFLRGKDPGFPEHALRQDLETIRTKVAGMRADPTTPDTRLADDPLRFNPAAVSNLVRLAMGGLHQGNRTLVLHARLRYFDPDRRRPGLPPDVAALVESMTDDETVVTVVNVSPVHPRRVVVQAGGYGEHEFTTARAGSATLAVNGRHLEIALAPGAGARIRLGVKRYAHPPSLAWPW